MCSIPGLPSPGSNVTVLITRVNLNPFCVLVEFWANLVQDQKNAYQQMKKEIQYPKEVFCAGEGKPGDLCLVQVYETWYRARIVSKNNAHYSVFLIDEGKTFWAHVSLLAWGQNSFFNLPPEVEFCILSNVLPLSPEKRWSKLALAFIKSYCGRTVTASVLDFAIPQRAFLLDIPCMSRQMQELGFAKKLSNEEFRDFVSRSLHSDAGPVQLSGTAFVESEPLEQIKRRMCYMYPELRAKTTETVLITEVISPQRVFCQLKVFSHELKKLTEQITQHYERAVGSHFAGPENLGSPCASKGADGRWYRSVLQQVMTTNNVVEVLHVDYGKKQLVQSDLVRPLAPEFLRMPVVTYVCSLHGVIDQGFDWTASQIDYLKSLLLNRTVIAKFEYLSPSEGVHYVTLYGDENSNINKLFGLREKCLIDLRCLGAMVPLIGTCERCHLSVNDNADETQELKGIFTESLSPNTYLVAVVQHVDSPSMFWIQSQKYAADFDLLMNELTELYSNQTRASGLIRKPVAGLLCVAKAKDNVFYRAAICEVIDNKAEVFFLDYGNKELVDCSKLCKLPLRYQNLPALAIKCALNGIQPRGKEWDLDATLFFSKAVVDKVLDVHVLAKSEDTHLVQVFDGEKDFSKLLCSAGFADIEPIDRPVATPYSKVIQTSNISKTCAVSQGSSFKEYLFPIGSSFDVIVSHIESPNDFWCQKANNANCLRLLMEDLQVFYTNSRFQPPVEATCIVRHPEKKLWFRALVIETHQASEVTVLFVDYGEMKRIPICELRHIDPEFLKLKGQAFRCCLYNLGYPFTHSSLVCSQDAMRQFQEFVDQASSMNVMLKCTVYAVMCNSQKVFFNVVDLESPFQSICRLLQQRGLADHAYKTAALPALRLDTYYYSSHSIKIGSEEDVCITYVNNVNQFFCHLRRNSVQIQELANQVDSLCNRLQSVKCPETFGNVCFVKHTDGLWYRGEFKSAEPSFLVHFVDYGFTQEVEESDLLPVPVEATEIMTIPVQAVECGLSDVPEKVSSEVNNWFKSFVTDRLFQALIVTREPSGKLIVELYDGKIPVNAIISEKFHIVVERNEQITVKARNRSYGVSEQQKGETQWTSAKYWRTQKRSDFEGNSGKRFNDHVQKDLTPVTAKQKLFQRGSNSEWKNAKPSVLKQAELPVKALTPGLAAEVFVSHCNSPCSFFVQLVTDERDICSLAEKLNDGQAKHVPVNPSDLSEGDLVCAMYPDDNCWYRAVVRNAVLSNTADVEFIDYGNTAEVSVINMSFLDQMFLQPRYSIHCSLSGVVNDDGDVASNFRTEIEKIAEAFLCKFIQHSGSVWEVKLEVSGQELFGSACSKDLNEVTPKSPDSGYNLCDYKNPDLSIGQTVAVYASVIIGPQLFWCQYAEGEKLQEISDIIQNIGCTSESSTLDAETIPIRSACIALFDEDQLWYRAKVTSVEKDMLSVLFVDYGNESKVKVSDIRPLPFEVSDVPPQAFACQLDGFGVSERSWNDKAADQFFELINDQHLRVTILKLATSCDVVSPLWVQLEREELNINDAMKTCWTRNSKKESYELENATIAVSVCETEHIVRSKDPICAAMDYVQNGSCISPPKEQEEGNDTLAEHVEQTESTPLLNETSVELAVILPQDGDRILTSAGTEKLETYGKSISLKDTNVNADIEDIHSNGPADVLKETQLDSTDFTFKGAFTGSQECEDENRVETVDTESPEDQSCEVVCGKANELVSKPEEDQTDHEIVESDPESRAGESGCVSWYHVLKSYDDSSLAEKETAQDDVNRSQVIDFEDMDEEPNAGMDLVVSKEQINLAQDKEQDPCFADVFAKSDCENQDSDLDLNAPQEMNQMFVADVSLEQNEPALETSSKLELAQNICRALVQIQGEETSPPAEEQKVDHVTETYELMEVIPAIPLEKAEETEQEAGQCIFSHGHNDELNEEPPDVVHPDITEEQPQDEQRGSSLGDLMPEEEDGIQGPDLDFDAPHAPQEKGEMFIVDVPVEQSEPAMENNPAVELAQDLKMQVQPVEEPEETNPPVDQQRAVDHVTETCEQGDVLMEVIPAIPLDKALDVALDADPDNFVNETEQRSCETSDMIQVNMSDTGLPAADTEPSASQKPSDAEEQSVLAVTHLSLRVEDTANDDVVFVKEWQVTAPEVNESRGAE